MNNPIKPTVGRVVYLTPANNSNIICPKDGVCAALITAVHNDVCVNLAVFDANGHLFPCCSVTHISTALVTEDGKNNAHHWDWMPYQKGQAAKTEQLEKKLFSGSVGCGEVAIESEIQAKGLNAPRLTPAEIDSKILGADYQRFNGTTVTICCLHLENGFTVTGESACASPENFDEEIGRKIAYGNAREKIWQLEGYLLKQELYLESMPSQTPLSSSVEKAINDRRNKIMESILIPEVIDVAKACHEINRAYCQAIGDDSQPSWDDAPEWQRTSAINGVKFHLSNPDASPSASHESWLAQKTAEGWKYGTVKNPDLKEHPCFVHYSDLPTEQKAKDYLFKQTVHSFKPYVFDKEVLAPFLQTR